MSSVLYQIQPKDFDTSNNETDYVPYTVSYNYSLSGGNKSIAPASGDTYYTLTSNLNMDKIFEVVSDQPVYLSIWLTGGTTALVEMPNSYNFVFRGDLVNAAGTLYVIKVRNMSGKTANIKWRNYGI